MEEEITFEFATHDDCLDKMVPSDLRIIVSERDQLRARNAELEAEVERLRKVLVDAKEELEYDITNGKVVLDDIKATLENRDGN